MKHLTFKTDLFCVGWYSKCVKPSFAQLCSLRLYVCVLPFHSSCVNFNFAHTCSLIQNEFSLACNLLHAKINFTDTCTILLFTIEYIHLPCKLRCFKLNLCLPAVKKSMYFLSHFILVVLNPIYRPTEV